MTTRPCQLHDIGDCTHCLYCGRSWDYGDYAPGLCSLAGPVHEPTAAATERKGTWVRIGEAVSDLLNSIRVRVRP